MQPTSEQSARRTVRSREKRVIRLFQRFVPMTRELHGSKLTVVFPSQRTPALWPLPRFGTSDPGVRGARMATPVNVGDVLAGKYQVERILGEGGMGVVVAARHLMLGERVAIKFLLPQSLAREDVVVRFLREGQAAARIRSEHVARVYDVGRLDRGEPYLVMEYLEGADLSAVLRANGRLPVDAVCDYVLQACDALAEAHSLGIVHRDLKPGNLFVARRADGSPIVKLIDFGISKVALTAEAGVPTGGDMTQSSVMMGSPLYMSPEQMMSSKSVDARSDVWSLGVILHQLLTNATPFNGDTIMEIYDRILQGPPPLRNVRPDAPERLERAILRCLRRNAAERFNNVAELAAELAPFAPPHALVLVERAARVLRVRVGDPAADGGRVSAPPRASSPSLGEGARASSAGVAASSGWGAEPASPGGGIGLAMTDRSWGGTRPPTYRGHGKQLAVGLAGGALVVAVGLGWLALHRAEPAAGPEAAASGAAPAGVGAPPIEAAAERSAGLAAPPPVEAVAERSAAAAAAPVPGQPAAELPAVAAAGSASAAPGPSASVAATPSQRPRVGSPAPRRPPPQQPDLFGDPR
jgi:eukaryotic-like serine/threonine-protein kinase